MLRVTKLLTLALVLAVSCDDEGDDGAAEPEVTPTPVKTPANPGNSNILKAVGPITVPFTLNQSNDPARVQVAEGENRVITMRMETAHEAEIHEEKVYTTTFKQTWHASSDITESFTVENKGIVDILLVVDDSGSLQSAHSKLKALASGNDLKLLKGISNSNWQLALADARPSGCLQALINKNNVADYSTFIQDIEDVDEIDHNERAVYKARTVLGLLSPACAGALGTEWLRPNATLAVVFVTDEDHQCAWNSDSTKRSDLNTYHCTMSPIADMFASLTTSGKVDWLKLYGIMDETAICGDMRPDASRCYDIDKVCSGTANPCYGKADSFKFRSANFVEAGFNIKDINRSDYEGIFGEIADDIKAAMQDRFVLKAVPDMSATAVKKLEVRINSNVVDSSLYTVDASNRVLSFNNQNLTNLITQSGVANPVIQVSYQVDGKPKHIHQFKIDAQADAEDTSDDFALTLSINNTKKVRGTDYSVTRETDGVLISLLGDDAARKVLFPEDAIATVTYRELPEHYPTLVLQHYDIVDSSIKVRVGGTATTQYVIGETEVTEQGQNNQQVTVKKKTLTFNSGHEPQHGQIVNITYTYYTSVKKLSYDDEINDDLSDKYSIAEVSCKKIISETQVADINCTHANGMITFPVNAFERDVRVRVNMKLQGLKSGEITIPDNLVPKSLKLTMTDPQDQNNTLECLQEKINSADRARGIIDLNAQTDTTCTFLKDWDSNAGVYMEYQTYVPNQVVVVVSSDILSYAGRYKKERWEVFIKGVKKEKDKDYTVKARKVTFTGKQPPDTEGKVDVYLEP